MKKKEKKVKKKTRKVKMGMRTKLIIMFVLLITIPLMALGTVSYKKSVHIMETSFEDTTLNILQKISDTIDNFTKGYEESVLQMALDPKVQQIVMNPEALDDVFASFKAYTDSHKEAMYMYMGTVNKDMYMYPIEELPEGYDPTSRPWYQEAVKRNTLIWTEPYADASSGELIISVAKPVYNKLNRNELVGVLAVDISLDVLTEKISNIKLGEKGYPILVSRDGNIMTHKFKELIGKPVPVPEVKEAMNQKNEGIVRYQWEEDGVLKDRLAVFTKNEKLGWTILGATYMDEINKHSLILLKDTLIFGLISLLIAVFISYIFSRRLTNYINIILNNMEKIRQGDFTVRNHIKASDEIGLLAEGFNSMMDEIAKLIKSIQGVSHEASGAAESLAAISEETSASAEEVARTVEEIAKGATDQAAEAEKGAALTTNLANKFNDLNENTDNMLVSASDVMEANLAGVKAMEELHEKTKLNDEATEKIENAIIELDNKTKHIGDILETISSIAEQTNLLALNASIEAARAGEYGKGFAVVADEIRKLAEDSRDAADEIKEIVVNITSDSTRTVEIMKEVKERSIEQAEAVEHVNSSFNQISQAIDSISVKIESISEFVKEMNVDNENLVAAIENISAVSEETAAASQEVTASMQQQAMAVDEVARAADRLNELSVKLNDEIKRFKI